MTGTGQRKTGKAHATRGGVRRAGVAVRLRAWALAFLGLLASGVLPALAETLTLEACLREVAENNPEIDRQRRGFEAALGVKLVLRAGSFPQLGVTILGGQQGERREEVLRNVDPVFVPGSNPPMQQRDARGRLVFQDRVVARTAKNFIFFSGNASQALFDYSIPAAWRRGEIETRVAAQNFYVTAVTVLHAARLQFYQALYERESGEIFREIGSRLAQNERNQREGFAAGVVSQLAPLQARLQQYNLETPTLAAGGNYRAAVITLLQLMGRDLGSDGAATRTTDPRSIQLVGRLETGGFTFDPAAAAADALRVRPDLQLLRELRDASREDSQIQRGGYFPLIRLLADGAFVPQDALRTNEQAIRRADQVRETEVRYGASFNWTVIDTGAVTGAVRTSRALSELFAVRLREAEANVPRDAARLQVALAGAAARRATLRRTQREATDVLNAVQTAVAGGAATQTEFLFAQNDLLGNRLGLLVSALNQSQARAEYDRLTGGYLRFVRTPPSAPAGK